MDLEEVWRIREEEIYPRLFGTTSRGIFTLDQRVFAEQFGQRDVDPRWLFYGVIEFAPTDSRSSWVYVTSGYSNPWDEEPEQYDPRAASGAGVEFLFMSTESGDWAIRTLQKMLAFDLLLSAGRFPNGKPLNVGDRVPLRAPIDGDEACVIRNLIVVQPEGVVGEFKLPSGKVEFASFTGATDAEIAFAKANTSATLIDRLRGAGHHPVTDRRRKSLI